MTKILYAIRSKAFFSYQETIINALLERNAEVSLCFDEHWSHHGEPSHSAFETWQAENPLIETQYYPIRSDFWRKPLMFMREVRSYNNYCCRGPEFTFYKDRWRNYLRIPKNLRKYFFDNRLSNSFFKSKTLKKITSLFEKLIPADKKIKQWLKEQSPDVLVLSPVNMRFSEEIELLKAAKEMGIITVIPILSWDNAATKGLFHIHPNKILGWHDGHIEECVNYHNVNVKNTAITGSPFFDKWFDNEAKVTSRDEFCQKVGLNSQYPYILYLGSSANIAKDETWFIKEIDDALKKSSDSSLNKTQILFRAHPANWKNGVALAKDGIPMWPKEGALPDTEDTFADFNNSLAHAAVIVGINTTGMVDAIICNKPVISPLLEKYKFTQENARHFIRMQSNDTLYIAKTAKDVVDYVSQLSRGEDTLAEARNLFIKRFVRPNGLNKSAGHCAADEILSYFDKGQIDMTNDLKNLFENFDEKCIELRKSPTYQHYLSDRDALMQMMQKYETSAYWYEEIAGFDYLFDASPFVVSKIREHCYHISGERSYIYRDHHSHKAPPYLKRLADLEALDKSNLFLPEPKECGGFGHETGKGKVNIDTLKFYEVLIGLDKSKFLEPFKNSPAERKAVLEIGTGWGGFAYQFKKLFNNTTYFCVDLPATLIFSVTYIRGVCPDAKIALAGEMPMEEIFERWNEFDFVFIPAFEWESFKPKQLDLAVNICSFQEMTTTHVTNYAERLKDLNCPSLYSLNRDRSPHNDELSLVSEILAKSYKTKPVKLLPTEYCTVGTKVKPKPLSSLKNSWAAYRHIAARLR